MTYGYMRVSTGKQDLDNQKFAILQYANEHKLEQPSFVDESVSGKISWKKRKIATLVDDLASSDILVVSELSRLGRSMLEIFELISILLRKNIEIHIVKGNTILKDDINSKVFTFAFSLGAEIERDLISQRTKEALAMRKASGKKLGRPFGSKASKLDDRFEEIKKYAQKGVSISSIAKICDVPQPTMYYFCKTRDLLNK